MVTKEHVKDLDGIRGLKAHHIPYELNDDGWQKNPEHEEEVILLEYFYRNIIGDYPDSIYLEGILFIRPDMTLGRDRLDSFTIIK